MTTTNTTPIIEIIIDKNSQYVFTPGYIRLETSNAGIITTNNNPVVVDQINDIVENSIVTVPGTDGSITFTIATPLTSPATHSVKVFLASSEDADVNMYTSIGIATGTIKVIEETSTFTLISNK